MLWEDNFPSITAAGIAVVLSSHLVLIKEQANTKHKKWEDQQERRKGWSIYILLLDLQKALVSYALTELCFFFCFLGGPFHRKMVAGGRRGS